MKTYAEEQLGALLRTLPPAPKGWVDAAQELPLARRELDDIVALAAMDEQFRKAMIADLEAALVRAGYEPRPILIAAVRARLSGSDHGPRKV